MAFNIAIDGPSASGKSTIAKLLANKLGFTHIDTGAMYRAVGLMCINKGVDLDSEQDCMQVVDNIKIEMDPKGRIFVNDIDYSNLIRNEAVSRAASMVSKHQGIRNLLVTKQQEMAAKKGYVMDGRDITSVVLPDAEIKIFQTANVSVRAQRRYAEMVQTDPSIEYEAVLKDLEERDYRDTHREVSPLIKVNDAIEIDTTEGSVESIVEKILGIIESRNLND